MRSRRRLALFAALCGTAPALQGQAVRDGYVVSADSVRIYYRIVGTGPDTVLVLHGGPGLTMHYPRSAP